MEMVLKFQDITAIFNYENGLPTFDVKILAKDELDQKATYEYTLHKLAKNNSEILYKINEELRSLMSDYIIDVISLYE